MIPEGLCRFDRTVAGLCRFDTLFHGRRTLPQTARAPRPRFEAVFIQGEAMLPRRFRRSVIAAAILMPSLFLALASGDDPFAKHQSPGVVGRWAVTVNGPEGPYPSWFEVRQSGYRTLVGTFVGRFGSA